MKGNIKPAQTGGVKVLKVLGKISILALQAIASFASDEKEKPQYTALKAKQLYEEGAISGSEYAQHIHQD